VGLPQTYVYWSSGCRLEHMPTRAQGSMALCNSHLMNCTVPYHVAGPGARTRWGWSLLGLFHDELTPVPLQCEDTPDGGVQPPY
jgi:hypothetical protein